MYVIFTIASYYEAIMPANRFMSKGIARFIKMPDTPQRHRNPQKHGTLPDAESLCLCDHSVVLWCHLTPDGSHILTVRLPKRFG